MSKTNRVFFDKIKFGKFARLVGFIKKKLLHMTIIGQIFASVAHVYSVVRRGTLRLQLPLLG